MPDCPDLSGVRAVALTCCPLLAEHLVELHPAIRICLLTRLSGIGTLPDTDALLLLTRHDPNRANGAIGDSGDKSPAGNGLHTTTVYIGTDLDDAGVWARAVKLRASKVLFIPSDDRELLDQLRQHLQASA